MSPQKQRKPSRQKKQTSDSVSPILPTNYREIHQTEVEALRSIYGDDFEEVENKRSAWQVGSFGLFGPLVPANSYDLAILRRDI